MARPAESGQRSVIPIIIGIISSPSLSRSEGVFTSSPTIPHMGSFLSKEFEVLPDFPGRDVALVLDPFHALELQELVGHRPERVAQQAVGLEGVERRAEVLRQGRDAGL